MLAIRMRKMGSKKRPFFRVVVTDSRAARDSSFVEIVGHYNPRPEAGKGRNRPGAHRLLGGQGREGLRYRAHAPETAREQARVCGRRRFGWEDGGRDAMSSVRDVIESVARALADSPQRVSVAETEQRGITLIEVTVAPPDVGKLIGRQGRTIQAMRTLASLTGERIGKKVTLEVRDV